MAIGAQQAAIRAVIASALADHVSESGQNVDGLVAMRQAEAIVRALEVAGYGPPAIVGLILLTSLGPGGFPPAIAVTITLTGATVILMMVLAGWP
jgi:hypothetical protein